MKFSNRTALVTGAAVGIGRAAARMLASGGADVALLDLNAEKLCGAEKEARQYAGRTVALPCDISREAEVYAAVSKAEAALGHIDILVNNAGVSDSTPIDKYTAERFASVMDLNVNAMMNGILPTVAIMKEQGGGCILNTSSMVSICGQPGGVAYPSSKYAVNGLTWSLARELGPFHIRVNAVAPGITRTDMVAALPKEMIDPLINRIPLRRIGEAEDIANAFLFLASDMASYVTGEILSVDGAMRS